MNWSITNSLPAMKIQRAIEIDDFWEEYADSHEGRYEYDEGQIVALATPDWLQALVLERLLLVFSKDYPHLVAVPEFNFKLSPSQVRKADFAVQLASKVFGMRSGPEFPVYLVVEMLTPGRVVGYSHSLPKTFPEAVARYQHFWAPWGVPYCWILDPHSRTAWHTENEFRQAVPELRAGEVHVTSSILSGILTE